MAKYHAIADPHGCLPVLKKALEVVDFSNPENRLFLLGDYIPHYVVPTPVDEFLAESAEALRFVKDFCETHEGQVVALQGNHEFGMLNNIREGTWRMDADLVAWVKKLPFFAETEQQIFVHAGIEEEAEDLWRHGTDDIMFCCKYPYTFGPFLKDIVAGHVATSKLFGNADKHDVFWDGQSHYYLDGTTEHSGQMPVLIYDTDTGTYSSRLATADGVGNENPVLANTPKRRQS